jgi:hypothetical protein
VTSRCVAARILSGVALRLTFTQLDALLELLGVPVLMLAFHLRQPHRRHLDPMAIER